MIADITPERIANSIMQDNSYKGYFFIVEGIKDTKIYGKFINTTNVKIKEAFGNEKVKAVIELLTKHGFVNKLGIIDSDFLKITGPLHSMDDIFLTDYHDIEVSMIKSKALEVILNIFCTKEKVEAYEKVIGKSIIEKLYELAIPIAHLKLANKLYDLGLVFKPASPEGNQIKYKNFICESEFKYKGDEILIETLINYSRTKKPELKQKEEITQRHSEVGSQTYDLNQLINGHDLAHILVILIKKILKSKNPMINDFNNIEDSLALAYSFDDFKKTELCDAIRKFETRKKISLLHN